MKNIIIHFPVRGHSYLPADRSFGRVEKLLKRKNIIISPEEYYEMYSKVGKVQVLGKDWTLYDIKNISDELYNKIPGIKNLKRIELKKFIDKNKNITVRYRGSEFYRFDTADAPYLSMVKRGKKENNFRLKEKALGNEITKEKKQNVQQLLEKQYNNEDQNIKWEELPELQFYKEIIFGNTEVEQLQNEEEEEEEEACDCLEVDCGTLHV